MSQPSAEREGPGRLHSRRALSPGAFGAAEPRGDGAGRAGPRGPWDEGPPQRPSGPVSEEGVHRQVCLEHCETNQLSLRGV